MKKLFFSLAILLPNILLAQIQLNPGHYKSEDGYITVTIEHEGDIIRMKEPTRSNEYKRQSGNVYVHTEEKYANYGIKVVDNEHFDAVKDGVSNHRWTYSGKAISESDFTESDGDCTVAEKYQELAKEDKSDTQVYTFCGAAALMKCNMNEEGFTEYVKQIIPSLKSILVNPNVNPCTDVFTAAQWNSN